jgi:hypothetical protein
VRICGILLCRNSTIHLLIAKESLLRKLDFRILLNSLIILVNLIPGVVVSLGKLLDYLRLSYLELLLWEHVAQGITLKGIDVLLQEL